MSKQKKALIDISAISADQESIFNTKLCSGFGQYHSDQNKNNAKPYDSITLAQIQAMTEAPQSVAKEKSQWVIFSNLASRDAVKQRQQGQFYALWADIDEPAGLCLEHILSLAGGLIPRHMMGYTSKSASDEIQKCRIIIPLENPVSGQDFEVLQKILNDKLETIGVIPDRKTETANQICYLPNKGEFYSYQNSGIDRLLSKADWSTEHNAEIEAILDAEREQERRFIQSRANAKARMESGLKSPIDAFNASYSPVDLLAKYGGKVKGSRAISPLSQSGNYQIKVLDDGKLLSHHGSDSEAGIGRETPSGHRLIDAWDLFVFYEHNGNHTDALHAAGNMFENKDGTTLEKSNQREYMERNSVALDSSMLYQEKGKGKQQEEKKPVFDFSKFSLNGMSEEMKKKMLEDQYVLGRLAILGQATVFYAKPNSGKTLLTIHMLCEAIDNNNINASDVFYVNADDNYRGLVSKLEIAEKHGFQMVAPDFNGFSVSDFADYMKEMSKSDICQGKVIILDTLKKFTDIMDKRMASEFGKVMRGFVIKGGTMILLAHTNKNRDAENKVVFSGTSDIVDDVDCAYTLDVTQSSLTDKTVLFENIKSRGDVDQEAIYSYSNNVTGESGGYAALLRSVQEVKHADADEMKEQIAREERLERNASVIESILECLEGGERLKTELIEEAHKLSGASKQKVSRVLRDHTGKDIAKGHRWSERKGEKNSRLVKAIGLYGGCEYQLKDYETAKQGY